MLGGATSRYLNDKVMMVMVAVMVMVMVTVTVTAATVFVVFEIVMAVHERQNRRYNRLQPALHRHLR